MLLIHPPLSVARCVQQAVHFSCWSLPIPRCGDLIIGATTFGYIVYVPKVGGFPVDASIYCDAFAQWLKQSFAQ